MNNIALTQNAELIKGQQELSMELVKNGTNNITNNNKCYYC